MDIAIIGAGNVGGTLAKRFAKKGHRIYLGVRNINDTKVKTLLSNKISAHPIREAVAKADVIVTAAYPTATREIAKEMGDVSGKVIIDAMNTFRGKPSPFETTADALLVLTNCKDVVRCFNTTGWQNMKNPNYHGRKIDMFVAGDSRKGKRIAAARLAGEIGFGNVYDLGGNEQFNLMEQIVIVWVGLAQILGRNIALNILTR
jgi:predicted dinucleotide-binding enzyme